MKQLLFIIGVVYLAIGYFFYEGFRISHKEREVTALRVILSLLWPFSILAMWIIYRTRPKNIDIEVKGGPEE